MNMNTNMSACVYIHKHKCSIHILKYGCMLEYRDIEVNQSMHGTMSRHRLYLFWTIQVSCNFFLYSSYCDVCCCYHGTDYFDDHYCNCCYCTALIITTNMKSTYMDTNMMRDSNDAPAGSWDSRNLTCSCFRIPTAGLKALGSGLAYNSRCTPPTQGYGMLVINRSAKGCLEEESKL